MTRALALSLRILLALGFVFCVLALVGGTMADRAVDARQMLHKFERYADTAQSGVDPAAYPELAQAITGYLKGDRQTAQVEVPRHGIPGPVFQVHELQHLEDVRELVELGRSLRVAALVLLALSVAGYLLLRSKHASLLQHIAIDRAMFWAAVLWVLLLAVMGVWALADFRGLFYALHRVTFANELWLLDPGKDLLLQLMPLELFISYGWDLLKQNAFVLLVLPLAAFGLHAARRTA